MPQFSISKCDTLSDNRPVYKLSVRIPVTRKTALSLSAICSEALDKAINKTPAYEVAVEATYKETR